VRRLIVATASAAVVALGAPPPAGAAWEPVERFQSRSGNTYCTLYQRITQNRASNKVECGARRTGDEACVNGYTLRSRGRTTVRRNLCGDPPADAPRAPYDTWLYMRGGTVKLDGGRKQLRCIFRRRTGVTCRNRSEHGFTVRVGRARTF
jgi:hypothetical protein